jgi:hypothetical protein
MYWNLLLLVSAVIRKLYVLNMRRHDNVIQGIWNWWRLIVVDTELWLLFLSLS